MPVRTRCESTRRGIRLESQGATWRPLRRRAPRNRRLLRRPLPSFGHSHGDRSGGAQWSSPTCRRARAPTRRRVKVDSSRSPPGEETRRRKRTERCSYYTRLPGAATNRGLHGLHMVRRPQGSSRFPRIALPFCKKIERSPDIMPTLTRCRTNRGAPHVLDHTGGQ